jgi:hypothetical protein
MLGGMDFEGEMGEALDRQAATQASIEAMVVKAAEDREAGPRRQGSKTAAAAARWRMAAAAKRQVEAPAKKRAAAVKRKAEAPAKKRAAAAKKTAAPTKRTAARAAKKTAKAAAAEEKGKHCRIRKRTKNSLCACTGGGATSARSAAALASASTGCGAATARTVAVTGAESSGCARGCSCTGRAYRASLSSVQRSRSHVILLVLLIARFSTKKGGPAR